MWAHSTLLLIVFFYTISFKGVLGDLSSNDVNPFQIVLLGVPQSIADNTFEKDSMMVKHTRVLEATYQWGSDLIDKCNYKVKAEAITVTKRTSEWAKFGHVKEKTRFFLKIYIDHRLLDIVEHTNKVKFDEKVIKDGLFINKVIVYTCDKLEIEYLMDGKRCFAKTYEQQQVYKEEIGPKYIEDWRWKAFDQEMCENSKQRNFEVEFVQKLEKYPFVIKST